MNRTLIIVRSKTGFAEKYAKWLSEEINAELYSGKIKLDKLSGYDNIILCGGVYAGRVNGASELVKLLPKLGSRRIAVVAVGASKVTEEYEKQLSQANLTGAGDNARLFYLRGGYNFERMGLFSRIFMSMLKKSLQKKENRSPEDDEMLSMMLETSDLTRRDSLWDVIRYVTTAAQS